jgi:hypothetical protein
MARRISKPERAPQCARGQAAQIEIVAAQRSGFHAARNGDAVHRGGVSQCAQDELAGIYEQGCVGSRIGYTHGGFARGAEVAVNVVGVQRSRDRIIARAGPLCVSG